MIRRSVARSDTPPRSRRIHELDALRGLAAVGVMLFHFTSVYDEFLGHRTAIPHIDVGEQGVQLFFLISGFVIFMSLERAGSGGEFVVGRIARLYPTYWVGLIVTTAVLVTFQLPGHHVGLGQFLAHLTMVHRWFEVGDIDGVYWTLAVELGFYGLMFTAYKLGCLHRIQLVGGLLVGLLFGLIIADALLGYPLEHIQTPRIFIGSLHLFFAGILLYRLPTHRSPAAVGLLAFCVVIEGLVNPGSVMVVAGAGGLVALVSFDRARFLRFPPLLFLGSISYPLYVLHQKVGDTLILKLYEHGFEHPLIILGLPIAVSVALAVLVHRAIEEPAQRRLRPLLTAALLALRGRRRLGWPEPVRPRRRATAATAPHAYNAAHAPSYEMVSEEARPWRQMRPASPVPATTSRT